MVVVVVAMAVVVAMNYGGGNYDGGVRLVFVLVGGGSRFGLQRIVCFEKINNVIFKKLNSSRCSPIDSVLKKLEIFIKSFTLLL